MTTIYLDAGALMVAGGTAAAGTQSIGTDAARMVSHLLAFGHDVVLLGDRGQLDAARASLPVAGEVTELESNDELDGVDSDAAGWLVTDSADRCTGARTHRRLKTVLVGSPPNHDLAHRPADRLARSLSDAVLDILATEAMPEPAPSNRDGEVGQPEDEADTYRVASEPSGA
jgi:hypothetical protein